MLNYFFIKRLKRHTKATQNVILPLVDHALALLVTAIKKNHSVTTANPGLEGLPLSVDISPLCSHISSRMVPPHKL